MEDGEWLSGLTVCVDAEKQASAGVQQGTNVI